MSFSVHSDGLMFSTEPEALEAFNPEKITVTASQGYYLWSYKGKITKKQALIASQKYAVEIRGFNTVYGEIYDFHSTNEITTWKEWRADETKLRYEAVRTKSSGYFWWTYDGKITENQA